MKRLYGVLFILLVASICSGCQNRLFSMRGARCRPGLLQNRPFTLPRWRSNTDDCNPCNQPGVVQGQGAMTEGSMGFATEPIDDMGTQYTDRPIYSEPYAVESDGAIVVPGPEAAPIPAP